MLYGASIISSFFFGFVESYLGIFDFNLTPREIGIIVLLSIVGIFFSMIVYAILSDLEKDFKKEIKEKTKMDLEKRGWKRPTKHRR